MPIIPIECSKRRGANILFRIKTKLLSFLTAPTLNYKKFPVIINNFNRLTYLQELLQWLESAGMTNIHIIDNQSDYKPLLDYYKKLPYQIYLLDTNMGQNALWDTVVFKQFSSGYYIYTDPDILPIKECSLNVIGNFYNLLQKYHNISKVGFGLKIDDLPDSYPLKQKVIRWESKFWKKEIEKGVYEALIDTTFALYRPYVSGGDNIPALRTGGDFVARHLPWYEDPKYLSQESIHYLKSATKASSWYNALQGEESSY
jgi:hypothetical protein